MAEKKKHEQSEFTVTDRRMFTADGDLRTDIAAEEEKKEKKESPKQAAPAATQERPAAKSAASETSQGDGRADREMPPPPSAAEQAAQAAAYRQSSQDLDSQVERSGGSAKEFEMTFERFLASLYMTAMLQLGLMHEQGGQPRIDIIAARQTIDTISLLAEKTKGNLTPAEESFLQNSLYELRMAYVEVTNALTRPPQAGPATGTTGR